MTICWVPGFCVVVVLSENMAAPAKRRNVEENPDDAPSDEDEEYGTKML